MITAAVPRPSAVSAQAASGAGAAAAVSQERRRSVWAILLRHRFDPAVRRDFKPGDMLIANEVGHIILREGVTGRVLTPLAELLELGPTQLAPVIGVDRTTARRYAQGDQALPKHSAETVLRLAELEAFAMDAFETERAAHDWLKKEHPMLGESPIDAASSSYGAQRVREILTAIKYGGVV